MSIAYENLDLSWDPLPSQNLKCDSKYTNKYCFVIPIIWLD